MGVIRVVVHCTMLLLQLLLCTILTILSYSRTLLWQDEFQFLDQTKWVHLVTTYPQDNFHYTRDNRANSWVANGHLHLMPTLTADQYGEEFLFSGELDLFEEDTEHPCNIWYDKEELCYCRAGEDIVKPIQLARLETRGKFSFRFGRVEVRAKLPLANWLRPAIWLVSENNSYGAFPASGELDLMEASGNKEYYCGATSRGVDTVQTNLHFGPHGLDHHWSNYTLKTNKTMTYAEDFHVWEIDWTHDHLAYMIDGEEVYRLTAPGPPGGLWDLAGFEGDNIYAGGGPMAPFDRKFHFILSFGSGGWPFYDYCDPPAPWSRDSKTPRKQF